MHIYSIFYALKQCHIVSMIEYKTEIAALGLIAWTILLLIALIFYRSSIVFFSDKPANRFSPLGDDLQPFGNRLTRAYANCTEFVPLLLGVLLFAIATGKTNITDSFAFYVLAARIAHSLQHLLSTGILAVGIRSLLLWIQIGVSVIWLYSLALSFS